MLPTITQNKALDSLKIGSEPYLIVKARVQGQLIVSMHQNTLVALIVSVVVDSIKKLGHYKLLDEKPESAQHIAENVIKIIFAKFRNLTVEEFKIIMDYGVNGRFKRKGQLDMVSVVYIQKWIFAYKNSDFIKNAFIDFNKKITELDAEKPDPTKEEQCLVIEKMSYKAWEDFKKDGSMPFAGAHIIYKFFKSKNKIQWTQAEKDSMTAQAEKNILEGYKKDKIGRKIKKVEFENLVADMGESKKLYMEKLRLALYKYFTKCKQEKITI